ncbi:unnamed protein product [Sphagnum jensenii]
MLLPAATNASHSRRFCSLPSIQCNVLIIICFNAASYSFLAVVQHLWAVFLLVRYTPPPPSPPPPPPPVLSSLVA